MSEGHRNCELGEIELSNRHSSCERIRRYTCSPTGNSSHSTVILWLACDRHSNDTTSHRASHPFFPIFQAPLAKPTCARTESTRHEALLNVRKLGAQQQNIKLIAGLRTGDTLRHLKENHTGASYFVYNVYTSEITGCNQIF